MLMQNAPVQTDQAQNKIYDDDRPTHRLFFWIWIQRLSNVLDRFGPKIPTLLIAIVFVLILISSSRWSKGGYAHPELERYIPHYLSDRPILQKIFDPNGVEVSPEFYRPRPLSYLVDDLDVAFIAWSCRHGHPHLLSASYYVFWGLDGILLWLFFRRTLGLDKLLSGLLICLWSTAPVVFSGGTYFRSAKPGGTFFMLAAFVLLVESFGLKLKSSNVRAALFALSGAVFLFCACLFDEIPIAFTLAAIVIFSFQFIMGRRSAVSRALVFPFAATLIALAGFTYYDFVLHPRLVLALSGAKVSMLYQTDTVHTLIRQPAITLAGSISVFTDALGSLMGRISGTFGLALLIVFVSVWQRFPDDEGVSRTPQLPIYKRQHALILVLAGTLLMLACLYGMLSRHPPISWLDVRATAYILPLSTVLLIFIAATSARSIRKYYALAGKLQLMLILVVASNLVASKTASVFDHSQDPTRRDTRAPGFTRTLLQALQQQSASRSDLLTNSSKSDLQNEVLNSRVYQALAASMARHQSSVNK
jgi:hypothetical protein